MKKSDTLKKSMFSLLLIFSAIGSTCSAQDQNVIKLPPPHTEGGKPLMNALNERQSNRDFIDKPLTDQQLSDLLWAAFGVNRPADKKRTAPSAHDKQEVDIYVTTAKGTYLFDASNHALIEINKEDMRSKTGKQGFVGKAAVNLVYVLNKKRASSKDETQALEWASVSTGAIVQNVYLFCASEGMGCVIRGWVDKEALHTDLNLNDKQVVLVAQTVGFRK